ncbi:hypothetical protein GGR44_001016 [Sphingobium fontiphilum]|uniref:DUF465 domain-containing protein n=1 Tax=Sphingobium fontiphilum TaxID=944425 RepID=A0A7W6DEZ9_9SPHN|nr:DUF465 domain-containing protein [Sphingobium fontiphilum]MBB3981369.1 hypothetical protein [Sphingobium fontiphilum]
MSEMGHDLHSMFPQAQAALHALKVDNPHFRVLADRYHDLTREIVRADSGEAPMGDDMLEQFKKERLALLDEVAALIAERAEA